jgi:2-oxo-4-hydroxy-4-carboxy-5-ureidoimidazoline decarboxylase
MNSTPLHQINALNATEFSLVLGAMYEHSPWIAERAFLMKPQAGFVSRAQLHSALTAVMQSVSDLEKLALLHAHPELAGQEATAGTLTAASNAEQASAGLTAMTAADVSQLRELNAAYREKFGFPFIIAVRNNTQSAIFGAVKSRLANSREMELNNALMQVGEIARLRLIDLISE